MARGRFRYLTLAAAAFLVYLTFPHIIYVGDYVRQTNPFSGQKKVEQAFVATEKELACLKGAAIPGDTAPAGSHGHADPIPNIVHFIFGLKNPLDYAGAGHFDFMTYLAVRSAIVSLKPEAVYLHYTYLSEPPSPDANADPLTNPWVRRLQKDIKLVHHEPQTTAKQYAHISDIMRLEFLRDQGGIYLDIDSFALRSFEHILKAPHPHDIVLGHEGGNRWGLCNAVMAARPNSTFVKRWLRSYETADLNQEWNYHSVLWPKETEQEYPDEVCALPPDAFFWPTWTWRHVEWMHVPLDPTAAEFWKGEIKKHGGSLFENQVAYHAWNQMAWDRYLSKLTPEIVRTRDTRFNLLMRRFMEDDL